MRSDMINKVYFIDTETHQIAESCFADGDDIWPHDFCVDAEDLAYQLVRQETIERYGAWPHYDTLRHAGFEREVEARTRRIGWVFRKEHYRVIHMYPTSEPIQRLLYRARHPIRWRWQQLLIRSGLVRRPGHHHH